MGRSLAEFCLRLDNAISSAETARPWRPWNPIPGRRIALWSPQALIRLGSDDGRVWRAVRVDYIGDRPWYGYTLTQARQIRAYLLDVMAASGERLEQFAYDHISEIIRPGDPLA